jgi:hypothetical protein
VGMFLHAGERFYMRGEGRWWPLPEPTAINVIQLLTFTEPPTAAIPIYDEVAHAGGVAEAFRIIGQLPGAGAESRQPRLFEDGLPPALRGRSATEVGGDLLAAGPFVFEVNGHRSVGMNLRRHHDFVWWSSPTGRSHYLDANVITAWFAGSDQVHLSSPNLGLHMGIRALRAEDAAWLVPDGARPRTLDDLVHVVEQPFAGSGADLVPDDGSWLLVDTLMGYTFGEFAVMVPEPPAELYALFQSDDGEEARADYAAEHGRRLLMPGAPGGTCVTELEEWDEPPWLIDPINGDSSWQPWHLVVVPRPEEEGDVQALYDDEDFVRSHAAQHGFVPRAPFRLHG